MRTFLFAILTVFVVIGLSGAARADYFVWQDSGTGLSFSFPDTWQVVNNAKPDDLLTVMAPSGRGKAICRVRARPDGRYKIFPPRYDAAIQKIDYSFDFWDEYLREYSDHEIYSLQNTDGLGRGYAGYALAGYRAAVPGPMMDRKALMFASLYHDTLFIMECSAHRDAFSRWKGLFLSIVGSVDFKKMHHEMTIGNYRNFMADPRLMLPGSEGMETIYY